MFDNIELIFYMTILLFLPTDSSFFILDSGLAPVDLAATINSGLWQPPADLLKWLAVRHHGHLTTRLCASVHESLVVISPASAGNLLHQKTVANPGITRRQREVLQGLLAGKTSRQIASLLGIRPRTVAWHINQLKKLLGTQTLTQSVARMVTLDSTITPPRKD